MATHPTDLEIADMKEIGKRIRHLEGMSGQKAKDVAAAMKEMFPSLRIDESKFSRWKSGTGISPEVLWANAAYFADALKLPRHRIILFLLGEAELSFGLRLVEDEPAATGDDGSKVGLRELRALPPAA